MSSGRGSDTWAWNRAWPAPLCPLFPVCLTAAEALTESRLCPSCGPHIHAVALTDSILCVVHTRVCSEGGNEAVNLEKQSACGSPGRMPDPGWKVRNECFLGEAAFMPRCERTDKHLAGQRMGQDGGSRGGWFQSTRLRDCRLMVSAALV